MRVQSLISFFIFLSLFCSMTGIAQAQSNSAQTNSTQPANRDGNNYAPAPPAPKQQPKQSAMPKSGGRDGNNYAETTPDNEPKNKTFSDRYRERFTTEGYRERNSSENYHETMIEEGHRRRMERYSGYTNIRNDYMQYGVRLVPPPSNNIRNKSVEIGPDTSIYHSGKGIRLPLQNNQTRTVDPMRQQQLRSMLQAPPLLQQYVNSQEPNNPTPADNIMPESVMPEPVGNIPPGFQQPQSFQQPQNNAMPGNQSLIPPVNQPLQPQPIDSQSQNNGVQTQQTLQTMNQQNTSISLPYPLNAQQSIQLQNQSNIPNTMLPFPLSNQVNQVQNKETQQPGALKTRPFSSQRDPRLNSHYQKQPIQTTVDEKSKHTDTTKTETPQQP